MLSFRLITIVTLVAALSGVFLRTRHGGQAPAAALLRCSPLPFAASLLACSERAPRRVGAGLATLGGCALPPPPGCVRRCYAVDQWLPD